MPGFPFPGRPGGEHDEPLLDMIIARRVLPPDAPPAMHDLERMLAALAGPAEPEELAGEAAVRAAFSRAASPARISPAARHRRSRRARPARSRSRLATAMVMAVLALGALLAAYSGMLPSSIQQIAHEAVAAPAPPSSGAGQLPGTGQRAKNRKATPSSGHPTPAAGHAAAPTRPAGPTTTSPSHYKPLSSASGYHPEPTCIPVLGQTSGANGSAHSSPPSSSQEHCVSIPGPTWKPSRIP